MSDVIQFYYNPMSRARIAHWALEESGLPYEMNVLDFDKAEHKKPEFLKLNPMGKVPAIVHRDHVVTEAAAILAYLADIAPEKKLAPGLQDPDRATYLRWLFFMATNWEASVLDKSFPRTQELRPSMLGYGSYADVAHAVETAIEPGPYILGERFTMADLLIGAHLEYSLMMKWIEPRPTFLAFVERCQARPAAKRANEQSMKIMEKMKTGK